MRRSLFFLVAFIFIFILVVVVVVLGFEQVG
jgi:hypothetical protein